MKRTKEEQKQWRIDHRNEILEQKKKYRKNNKDKINKYFQEYRKDNNEKFKLYSRRDNLKHQYNMSIEEYDKLFKNQNGKCAICGNQSNNLLCVDHNHHNGNVRGLLCKGCNFMLGHCHDEIETLKRAIEYLSLWTSMN